ncbi:hypothetical protein GGI21_003601, partial [Coemansia aciculifera]
MSGFEEEQWCCYVNYWNCPLYKKYGEFVVLFTKDVETGREAKRSIQARLPVCVIVFDIRHQPIEEHSLINKTDVFLVHYPEGVAGKA